MRLTGDGIPCDGVFEGACPRGGFPASDRDSVLVRAVQGGMGSAGAVSAGSTFTRFPVESRVRGESPGSLLPQRAGIVLKEAVGGVSGTG